MSNLLANNLLKYSKRTVATLSELANDTIQSATIPRKRGLLKLASSASKDFVSNPIGFLKEGTVREQLSKQLLSAGGVNVPTKKRIAINVARTPEAQELIVNTSGFIGSKMGAVIGSKPGALTGDLMGATVARRGIEDAKVVKSALAKLRAQNPNFDSLSPIQKTKLFLKESNLEKQRRKSSREENLLADTTGWAIGNGTAETFNNIPGLGSVPLTGAGVALPSTKRVVDNIYKARRGEIGTGQAVSRSIRDIALSPIQTYRNAYIQGIAREKAMYDRGNKWLQEQLGREPSTFSYMCELVYI